MRLIHTKNIISNSWLVFKKIIRYLIGKLYKNYSTSISDNLLYPNICINAVINSKNFIEFRNNSIYMDIVENVTLQQGSEYLKEIKQQNGHLLDYLTDYKLNDLYGNPYLSNYPDIGKISPTTIRYIKVFADLLTYFKTLEGLNIAEIGVGYGGQCRVIHAVAPLGLPQSYTLIDLKPALMLAQEYLDKYFINATLSYQTMHELQPRKYDLVISNYAFSELVKPIQEIYLQKVILNSKAGYITYNHFSESLKNYSEQELVEIIPNAEIFEERPLTHKNNCIIAWGMK